MCPVGARRARFARGGSRMRDPGCVPGRGGSDGTDADRPRGRRRRRRGWRHAQRGETTRHLLLGPVEPARRDRPQAGARHARRHLRGPDARAHPQIRTTKRATRKDLRRDAKRTTSRLPVVLDAVDFAPYGPVFIAGEVVRGRLVQPLRTWLLHNKAALLAADHPLVFFCYAERKKDVARTFDALTALLGEPRHRLPIYPDEYPFFNVASKIGFRPADPTPIRSPRL